jgi:hypothetical protein
MLQTTTLVFSLLLASIYATAFHLWLGQRLRDLPLYWLAATLGFAIGQIAGETLDRIPFTMGQIRIIEATLGSILFLLVMYWLRQDRSQ